MKPKINEKKVHQPTELEQNLNIFFCQRKTIQKNLRAIFFCFFELVSKIHKKKRQNFFGKRMQWQANWNEWNEWINFERRKNGINKYRNVNLNISTKQQTKTKRIETNSLTIEIISAHQQMHIIHKIVHKSYQESPFMQNLARIILQKAFSLVVPSILLLCHALYSTFFRSLFHPMMANEKWFLSNEFQTHTHRKKAKDMHINVWMCRWHTVSDRFCWLHWI